MINTSLIVNKTIQTTSPLPLQEKKSKPSLASKTVDKVIATSEKIWGYLSKMMGLAQHSLNMTLKSCQRIATSSIGVRMTSAVTHLKFLSIFGLAFTVASIPDAIYKIFRSLQLKDKEGTALAGLSFVVITGGVINSVTSIINTGLAMASKIPLEILSTIGVPLSFALLGLSSIISSVQLAKTYLLYNKFKKEVVREIDHQTINKQEIYRTLWKFLDKKLGAGDEKMAALMDRMKELEKMPPEESAQEMQKLQKEIYLLLAQKRLKLQRSAPPDVVAKFEKIFVLLNKNKDLSDTQVKEILSDLDQIMAKFKKKMAVEVVNLIANTLTLIGMCLMLSTAPAPVGIAFLAAALILRLSFQIYQDVTKAAEKRLERKNQEEKAALVI